MSQQVIHETAIVKPGAKIADNVTIGPYCVVGSDVTIGEGSILMSHVSLVGNTVIGKNNKIYQGAVIGTWPQDISFTGGDTRVEIGDDNVIREYVTIHRGTHKDKGVTSIGDNNYIMAYAHIAHDCEMGNGVILSNGVQLAGHVKMEDKVNVGGLAAFHHFVTVGRLAFVGGMTRIVRDVPPFMTVEGNPSKVRCVNVVGCSRNGMDTEAISDNPNQHSIIALFRSINAGKTGNPIPAQHGATTGHCPG